MSYLNADSKIGTAHGVSFWPCMGLEAAAFNICGCVCRFARTALEQYNIALWKFTIVYWRSPLYNRCILHFFHAPFAVWAHICVVHFEGRCYSKGHKLWLMGLEQGLVAIPYASVQHTAACPALTRRMLWRLNYVVCRPASTNVRSMRVMHSKSDS